MKAPQGAKGRADILGLLPLRTRLLRHELSPILRRLDDGIATFKPGLIRVTAANLIITGDCNIKCAYCEYPTRYHGLKEFTTAQWTDVIGAMRQSGVTAFNILGGEPLLRPDWAEIVDACAPAEVGIVTNGTFINERIADKLPQRFRRLRVSLDASNATTHERVRRNTRFEHVLAGLRFLRARGVAIEISYVIVDGNVSDMRPPPGWPRRAVPPSCSRSWASRTTITPARRIER